MELLVQQIKVDCEKLIIEIFLVTEEDPCLLQSGLLFHNIFLHQNCKKRFGVIEIRAIVEKNGF